MSITECSYIYTGFVCICVTYTSIYVESVVSIRIRAGSQYTGSFKKIWKSSTLATEVTGPDTLWLFSYGDTLKTMPTNHKLQDRIGAAVQTIEGEQVS